MNMKKHEYAYEYANGAVLQINLGIGFSLCIQF